MESVESVESVQPASGPAKQDDAVVKADADDVPVVPTGPSTALPAAPSANTTGSMEQIYQQIMLQKVKEDGTAGRDKIPSTVSASTYGAVGGHPRYSTVEQLLACVADESQPMLRSNTMASIMQTLARSTGSDIEDVMFDWSSFPQEKFLEGLSNDMRDICHAPPDASAMRRAFNLERMLSGQQGQDGGPNKERPSKRRQVLEGAASTSVTLAQRSATALPSLSSGQWAASLLADGLGSLGGLSLPRLLSSITPGPSIANTLNNTLNGLRYPQPDDAGVAQAHTAPALGGPSASSAQQLPKGVLGSNLADGAGGLLGTQIGLLGGQNGFLGAQNGLLSSHNGLAGGQNGGQGLLQGLGGAAGATGGILGALAGGRGPLSNANSVLMTSLQLEAERLSKENDQLKGLLDDILSKVAMLQEESSLMKDIVLQACASKGIAADLGQLNQTLALHRPASVTDDSALRLAATILGQEQGDVMRTMQQLLVLAMQRMHAEGRLRI